MGEHADDERLWGAAALGALRALDAVVEVNSVGVVASWNGHAEILFGVRDDDGTGQRTLGELVAEHERYALDTAIMAAHEGLASGVGAWRGVLDLVGADGTPFCADVTVIPAPDELAGSALLVCRDLDSLARFADGPSEVLAAEAGAAPIMDPEQFTEMLDAAFARPRNGDDVLAVMCIEHAADEPDDELRHLASVLAGIAGTDGAVAVRSTHQVAMMVDHLPAPFYAANLADRVTNDLREARGDGAAVTIGIGFSTDDDIAVATDILDHAEQAARRSVQAGGGRWEIFDDKVRDEVAERRRFRDELYGAIDAGDFRVHYQPANDASAGRITMVEALVRWDHPERGLVAAGEFVDLAEETGLILPLGAWVLNEACRQLRSWLDELGESAPVVTVNFSGHQLHHANAVELVAGVIEANGLDPQRLCIEIAESVVAADRPAAIARMHALRTLGVRLSLDHFGVSAGSVAGLDGCPVDLVKVDRSLVNASDADGDPRDTIEAIVLAAHAVGAAVGAEGVETAEQLDAVTALGCDQIQGFYLARPQSGDDVTLLVANGVAGEVPS
jgi:EAL domain-containing protein (putative c-di-GMP-specific phosphodiesterase class I)